MSQHISFSSFLFVCLLLLLLVSKQLLFCWDLTNQNKIKSRKGWDWFCFAKICWSTPPPPPPHTHPPTHPCPLPSPPTPAPSHLWWHCRIFLIVSSDGEGKGMCGTKHIQPGWWCELLGGSGLNHVCYMFGFSAYVLALALWWLCLHSLPPPPPPHTHTHTSTTPPFFRTILCCFWNDNQEFISYLFILLRLPSLPLPNVLATSFRDFA